MNGARTTGAGNASPLRNALILATERLVALRGVAGVTALEILEAAGSRNSSAIQYHFGSFGALLQATFDHRAKGIMARMQSRLDAADPADIREVVAAMVWPHAEEISAAPGPSRWARFALKAYEQLADPERLQINPGYEDIEDRFGMAFRGFMRECPRDVADLRITLLRIHVTSSLAAIEDCLETMGAHAVQLDSMIETVIDTATGMLMAPVSTACVLDAADRALAE